ncbi:MAG TPA: NADH-quinone oxidoreductase subunit NuoH [Bdellovibrionota bacterium]|jgi:NADH-quinone oxidoreductase subunit H|nr:NADH-quinone oxidoreductase subunit NuoH [Bdellovibrionota bacterium]
MIAFWFPIVLAPVLGVAILSAVPVILTIERRGAAWIQRRSGPNRVGPWGLLQALADALKFVFKEEGIPAKANKALFILAPVLAVVPPFLAFAAIPLGGYIHWDGQEIPLQVANFNVGLIFLMAITSLHVFSVLIAGWASNNKFSLLGALRASSQMISYEIAIGISVVSLVMLYGTVDLREIVKLQEAGSSLPLWGAALQPLCFLIMWVCVFAETNRLPFDLPEGESELVAGYHTEYAGLMFALFFLGEYAAMFLASAFMATLFLGGYNVPFISEAGLREFFMSHGHDLTMASLLTVGAQAAALIAKIFFFMWVFVWVRWTLPRFRYDQLMDLGWKTLLPLGVLNVIVTMVVTFWLRT